MAEQRIVSRFFQAMSTWYTPLTPANTVVHPQSQSIINYLSSITASLGTSTGAWSHPIFYAAVDTPIVKVGISGNPTAAMLGWDLVPIPVDARPSSQTDGHLVIISSDKRTCWELYQARRISGTQYAAARMRRWDLLQDGVQSPSDRLGAVRQFPAPLLHGLVTYEEMQRGVIDHALAMTAHSQGTNFWAPYPGEVNLSGQDQVNVNSGVMAGQRLQLDPLLDLATLNLPPHGLTIARALQVYGGLITDGSDRASFDVYFENCDARPDGVRWGSTLAGALYNIPKQKLRIVSSPVVAPPGPVVRVQSKQVISIKEGNPLAPGGERYTIPAGRQGVVQSISITVAGVEHWFVNFDDVAPGEHSHSWVPVSQLTVVSVVQPPVIVPPVIPPVVPPTVPPVQPGLPITIAVPLGATKITFS